MDIKDATIGTVLFNQSTHQLVRVYEDKPDLVGRIRVSKCAKKAITKVGEKTLAQDYRLATDAEIRHAVDLEEARGPHG